MSLPKLSQISFARKVHHRACYPSFYFKICDMPRHSRLLCTDELSLLDFMTYVFQQFRADGPHTTVVIGEFSKRRKLTGCLVYEPRQPAPVVRSTLPTLTGEVIHLYYGEPPNIPDTGRVVVFRKPMVIYKERAELSSDASTLFLPVCYLHELLDWNHEMYLGISPEAVKQRFELFGGLPEICLSCDQMWVAKAEKDLYRQLSQIKAFDDITRLLSSREAEAGVFPRFILHITPENGEPYDRNVVQCASPRVAALVDARLAGSRNRGRMELYDSISGVFKFKPIAEWIFKGYCGEMMKDGNFRLKPFLNAKRAAMIDLRPGDFEISKDNWFDGIFMDHSEERVYHFRFVRDRRFDLGFLELPRSPEDYYRCVVWVVPEPCDTSKWCFLSPHGDSIPAPGRALVTLLPDAPQYLLNLNGKFGI